MSSLRNATYRRNHPERPQPLSRSKFGLLEKKKDYIKRAQDRHRKEDLIKKLKEKARLRNKDEFYFSMVKSKTKNGVHIAERDEHLPEETVRLIKDQYLGYINLKETTNKKQLENLKQSILITSSIRKDDTDIEAVLGENGVFSGKHIHFKDSSSEEEEIVEKTEEPCMSVSNKYSKKFNSLKDEFFKRADIENKLKKIQTEYELRKNLRSKGAHLIMGKDENGLNTYRWRQCRKK